MLSPLTRARAGAALLAVVTALVLAVPALVPATASASSSSASSHTIAAKPRPKDPRMSRGLYVDPSMKAYQAGGIFRTKIGSKAQPLWITDYYGSRDGARGATRAYVEEAARARKTPLLVVYNIPDRDCGMYSSQDDQITDAQYRSFVTGVAEGLRGTKPILVLEPDAIPFIGNPSCSGRGDRLGLLKYAVRKLTAAGAWVYLDAGHSGWQTPEHMAPLLKAAGVGYARGIATNVANSRAGGDEVAYAKAIIRNLAKLKVRGVHYVTDTSRNGAGRNGPANGDVCNPTAARLGLAPRLVFQGAFDGRLWVKLPGESDGPCNGGPNSGEWFPTGACRLLYGPNAYASDGQHCRN